MSKEVDIKKLKKEAAKAKRKAVVEKSKRKAELIEEEEELKTNKTEYDRAEYIRRKVLNDMVNKELNDARFSRIYDKFYDEYKDDDQMALFMILIRLSYDYDTSGFVSLIKKVLKNIKTKESGAIVKSGKTGSLSNFYETSSILELLTLIDGNESVISKYNKRRFLSGTGEYNILDHFGTIEQATKKEMRLLEKMFQDSVRLGNLWRKKVEQDADVKGKKYKEVQYDEKELNAELEDERERYNLLLEISSLENKEEVEDFFSNLYSKLRYSDNNNLFKELLYLYNISDIKYFKNYIEDTLEIYNDNHNTILSLLDQVKNKKILKDRYSSVRKAIKEEFRTLENKYGPVEELFDLKKMEFLAMEKGLKYEEQKEVKREQKEDKKVVTKDEDIELEGMGDYKDVDFYPLIGGKDKGKGKVVRKPEKKISDEKYIIHNLDTRLKDFSKENLSKVRNVSLYFLKKFFDIDSSKDMEKSIYDESGNSTLRFYLTRLGKIIILVDTNGIKHLAKLLNERLSDRYYDIKDLLTLSYKELLQDIYADTRNKDFKELEDLIDIELNRFFKTFIRFLGFVSEEDIQDIQDIEDIEDEFGADYEKIYRIDSIEPCNIEFKGRAIFRDYLKLKSLYNSIDKDNQKEKLKALGRVLEEEKKIRPFLKNIVYYREDNNLYCFTYFDLEERFGEKNYINPYTEKNFSDDFISDLSIVMGSKKKKAEKFKEEEEEDKEDKEFLKNIFETVNILEVELKDKVSKEDACSYYKKFIFPYSDLEKMMKKDKSILVNLKSFCGVIQQDIDQNQNKDIDKDQDKPKRSSKPESEKSNISLEKSPIKRGSPKSQLSIPSIVFGNNKDKKKEIEEISLPLLSPKKSIPVESSIPSSASSVQSSIPSAPAYVAPSAQPLEESKPSGQTKPRKDKKMLLEMLSKKLEPEL